ncbi:hypothetical protein GGS23DRAFT_599983 [Durotheca rogersii]|uniref:uncharacterized protein n=1 Tax=Durotheca rogersii TaxID=419775 RepID=UPI002220BE67|nr:uncharacterized protein GGS23DRAFT_599983 [Durotheca rogersii]KAI5859796.1 hypothetical protein GGS23DRAFT_599983 [Durotheca rogersii]
MGKHDMSKSDSQRIQSSQAKSGGDMSSRGFASRAQGSADRHAASSGQQGGRIGGSGGGGGGGQSKSSGGSSGGGGRANRK